MKAIDPEQPTLTAGYLNADYTPFLAELTQRYLFFIEVLHVFIGECASFSTIPSDKASEARQRIWHIRRALIASRCNLGLQFNIGLRAFWFLGEYRFEPDHASLSAYNLGVIHRVVRATLPLLTESESMLPQARIPMDRKRLDYLTAQLRALLAKPTSYDFPAPRGLEWIPVEPVAA
jgi:hypothetical protein